MVKPPSPPPPRWCDRNTFFCRESAETGPTGHTGQNWPYWSKLVILVKTGKTGQNWLCWSKLAILVKTGENLAATADLLNIPPHDFPFQEMCGGAVGVGLWGSKRERAAGRGGAGAGGRLAFGGAGRGAAEGASAGWGGGWGGKGERRARG